MKVKDSVIVLSLFIFLSGVKLIKVLTSEGFNFRDETGIYWTESAFQYKIAKEISKGNSLNIFDLKAQYPEKYGIRKNITFLMMSIAGIIYRFFIPKNISFLIFLTAFMCLYSSITIFPLYFFSYEIYKDKKISFLITLLYSVSLSSYITIINIGYEFQDFAIPFIFLHLYFFIKNIRTKKDIYAFFSGIFLLIALLSWLLTIFYFLLFVFMLIILYVIDKEFRIYPFVIIVLIITVGSLIFPVLISAGFIYSLPMLISYSFIGYYFLPKTKIIRILSFFLFVLLIVSITFIVSKYKITGYGVVYKLIIDRIKVLLTGIERENLSYETLVMWVSPFTSPSLKTIVYSLGMLTITGITGAILFIIKYFKERWNIYLIFPYFTFVFYILYLFFIRMDVFLVFFLSLTTGMIFKYRKKVVYPLIFVSIVINLFLLLSYPSGSRITDRNYLIDILKYIRNNTEENEPILATFPLSATILAYTDRPILLHPKFEVEGIIRKNKEFEMNLFFEEESLYKFCKKYGAEYLIYQTDILLSIKEESVRYRTHNFKIGKENVAFKMHFRPQELKHFQLLYSNPHYRVYKIQENGDFNIKLVYLRIYDERRIKLEDFYIY